MTRPQIFFIATVDYAIKVFLINHLKKLSRFYRITVFVNTQDKNFLKKRGVKVKVHKISISRNISIIKDLYFLFYLFFIFLLKRPAAVHTLTPKAGLLGMLASFFAFVPLRIHTFTGQVWITSKGIKKYFLKFLDKLIAKVSTKLIIDSHSQKKFLIRNKIINKQKSFVFANGSISGVNIKKFTPNKKNFQLVRSHLSIPRNAFVILFLGRINIDKGVLDLVKVFNMINSKKLYLVLVGPDEGKLSSLIKKQCIKKIDKVRLIKFTDQPNLYLSMANVVCLPSYREGFGNIIIEAAATGVPSIGSDIYGIKDAIVNKKSGLLHKKKNVKSLMQCINFFLNNPKKLKQYSHFAMTRARLKFNQELITNCWIKFYKKNINKKQIVEHDTNY